MILNSLAKIQNTGRLFVSPTNETLFHGLHQELHSLSQRQQWIMFTSQCPRQSIIDITAHQSWCHKVIHLMPSRQLTEFDVIKKAILSGNASAIVASDQMSRHQQSRLFALAQAYDCHLFFVDTTSTRLH
jgi:hypothetical protein